MEVLLLWLILPSGWIELSFWPVVDPSVLRTRDRHLTIHNTTEKGSTATCPLRQCTLSIMTWPTRKFHGRPANPNLSTTFQTFLSTRGNYTFTRLCTIGVTSSLPLLSNLLSVSFFLSSFEPRNRPSIKQGPSLSCNSIAFMKNQKHQALSSMELTILSAQGLKSPSYLPFFYHPLRTFVALTAIPPDRRNGRRTYKTRVDEEGDANPAWSNKFEVPADAAVYLQVYARGFVGRRTKLGWCHIPASDIMEGLRPDGSVHHLSYRLRAADGSRGHGIINVSLRLEGAHPAFCSREKPSGYDSTCLPVMGIPVGICCH